MNDIVITHKKTPDPEFAVIEKAVWVAVYCYEGSNAPFTTYNVDRNELLKSLRHFNGIDKKRGVFLYKLESPE